MSPQEKRHGVMAQIRTSDLTIKRPTLYHLSYPARPKGLKTRCFCLLVCLMFYLVFVFALEKKTHTNKQTKTYQLTEKSQQFDCV
jgi:hypothetical protein